MGNLIHALAGSDAAGEINLGAGSGSEVYKMIYEVGRTLRKTACTPPDQE